MSEDYQRRYVAYAKSQGRTPEDQEAHDKERWPGGRNAGFILWINEQWREWREATGARDSNLSDADHAAFDLWLTEKTRADRAEAFIAEIKRRWEAYASVTAGARFHRVIPEDAP